MSLKDKRFLIRADSGFIIGTGHVMRMLALADTLRTAGAYVHFVSRTFEGHIIDFIRTQKFDLTLLPTDTQHIPQYNDEKTWLGAHEDKDVSACFGDTRYDAVIVDHYGVGQTWLNLAQQHANKTIVVDDTAERDLVCDLVINQNYYPDPKNLYSRARQSCIGPSFALLRPEFTKMRLKAKPRVHLKHLLVVMGGRDVLDVGGKIAAHIVPDRDLRVTIIGNRQETSGNITFIQPVQDMAAFMTDADFCIGAAGSTTWERCCLYLPSALFTLAANQKTIADNLAVAQACIALGTIESFDFSSLNSLLHNLIKHPDHLSRLSKNCGVLCDGLGTVRIRDTLQGLLT